MEAVRHRRALAVGAFTAACVVAGLVVRPVGADDFEPENHTPALTDPALVLPGGQVAIEPDAGASDEVYGFEVTVADDESLADLAAVTLCWHHSTHEDGESPGDGDPTCTDLDPRHTVRMSWTPADGTFALEAGGSTHWELATGDDASSAPSDLDALSGTVTFRFRVSEAMREGTWTVVATVEDTSGTSDSDSTVTATVAPYSAITMRAPQSFGSVAALTPVTATDTPVVVANGATRLSLQAGAATSPSGTFQLLADGPTSSLPGTGELTLDCNLAGSFTEGTATRIGSTPTDLGIATATGTPEGGVAVPNTCRLLHGGGRPVDVYDLTVVNTVTNV